MITYDDMVIFTREYNVLVSKIGIINEMLGCTFQQSIHNPCTLSYSHGRYTVTYDGYEICTFGTYDVQGVEDAVLRLGCWSDCVWNIRRSGFVVV